MRTSTFILILLVVIAIALGSVWAFSDKTATPIPGGSGFSGTEYSSSKNGCGGCVGIKDNGRTIAVVPTSRITIELPAALYDRNAFTITPSSSLGETFGATASPGDWVRTFEAVKLGTTTITVRPSAGSGGAKIPYTLMIRIVAEKR